MKMIKLIRYYVQSNSINYSMLVLLVRGVVGARVCGEGVEAAKTWTAPLNPALNPTVEDKP